MAYNLYSDIFVSHFLGYLQGIVRRCIIHKNDFNIRAGLMDNTFNTLIDMWFGFIEWYYNGYSRSIVNSL